MAVNVVRARERGAVDNRGDVARKELLVGTVVRHGVGTQSPDRSVVVKREFGLDVDSPAMSVTEMAL